MNISRTPMNFVGQARRRYVVALLSAALCGAAAAIPFATSSASAQVSPNALAKQLESALGHVSAVIAHHHTPTAKALNEVATLAHKLQRTATQAPRCRAALVAAERLPMARHHRHKLAHDVAAATHGLPACAKSGGGQTTSTSTTSPTSTTSTTTSTSTSVPSDGHVGGTVDNASGQPAAGVTVSIDVEFVIGVSGEGETATTDSAGHFEFADLSAASVQPWWHFLDPTGSFVWNGGAVTLGLDAVNTTNPADLQYKLDGSHADTVNFAILPVFCDLTDYGNIYPISVTLTPVGTLADGAAPTATTLSLSASQVCDGGSAAPVDLGAWQVSGATTANKIPLQFSTDGGQTYGYTANVLDQLTSSTPPQWASIAGVLFG